MKEKKRRDEEKGAGAAEFFRSVDSDSDAATLATEAGGRPDRLPAAAQAYVRKREVADCLLISISTVCCRKSSAAKMRSGRGRGERASLPVRVPRHAFMHERVCACVCARACAC